jgi:hypothetical protein
LRPEKTLREHAIDGTFRPSRHAGHLETDDTLLPSLLTDEDDEDQSFLDLASLQLRYRASASAPRRREILRAFTAVADREPTAEQLERAEQLVDEVGLEDWEYVIRASNARLVASS